MRPGRLLLAAVLLLAAATPADAAASAWEHWREIPGVFDVDGPRADGSLVVAAAGRLFRVDPAGGVTPFAGGPQGYADDAGAEAYMVVSPGLRVAAAGCDFTRDDVFVLRLHQPLGVTRIGADGRAGAFATVTGVETLGGIAFDTTGRFGSRLLVTGPHQGRTTVVAIDCRGATQVITDAAPAMEGGLAVAPVGFGAFGGALIAPDELSGRIYAIAPNGAVSLVVDSGLPTGGDIGVESVGFVPPGLVRGGWTYYADRGTPNNPHPGTDSLLRLPSSVLRSRGVRDGDLLAAAEGGAAMIGVRCEATCRTFPVVETPTSAHGEGHIAFAVDGRPSSAVRSMVLPWLTGGRVAVALLVLFALAAFAAGAALLRAGRRR
jgi:hypothetical protein